MRFRALRKEEMTEILTWRESCPESLRTNRDLTLENQLDFYLNTVSNRNSNARWWGIDGDNNFVETLMGYCGIENIEWENRIGEISLLINPMYQNSGLGEKAIETLLDKGFNYLNLDNIYGETYYCSNAVYFWDKIIKKYNGTKTKLPNRKYFDGKYYDSMYFNFTKEELNECLR